MLRALLSVFCIILGIGAWAQVSITVSPHSISGSGSATSPDIPAYCHVTNNTAFAIDLFWHREVMNAPAEWTSWVCDMTNCYLPHVDDCPESRPNTLEPGQSFELSYHARPDSVEGQGQYRVYFFEGSDPDLILDSVDITIETSTSAVGDVANEDLRIFPNPTTSYFQINQSTNVARVVVYNMVGNLMREFDARNTSHFDVSNLPQAIYLVRLFDSNQRVLKTVRLSKR